MKIKSTILALICFLTISNIEAKPKIPRLKSKSLWSVKKVASNSISKTFTHKPKKVFYTYSKTHPTLKPYSGRTSGSPYKSPTVAMKKRENTGHHMDKKGYENGKITGITTDNKVNRMREQKAIDANGGSQSEGGNSGNAIRGIAKNKMPKSK